MTDSSRGFDWSSIRLCSWLSIVQFLTLLPFGLCVYVCDLCPPNFLQSVLQPHPVSLSFWSASIDWMWQIISIWLYLAWSGCVRVIRFLTELVMRDGLVMAAIYYGSEWECCCSGFSPEDVCLPVRPWLCIHINTELVLGSEEALLRLRN